MKQQKTKQNCVCVCVRKASVIAETLSSLVKMDKTTYIKVIKEAPNQDDSVHSKIQFFQRLPLFSTLEKGVLEQLVSVIEKCKFAPNEMILDFEGFNDHFIYWVDTGKYRIVCMKSTYENYKCLVFFVCFYFSRTVF